jgi:MFS family permease
MRPLVDINIYHAIIYILAPATMLSPLVLSLFIAIRLPKESRLPAVAGLFSGIIAFAIYVVSSFSDITSAAIGLNFLPAFKLVPVAVGGVVGFGLLLLIKFLRTARAGLVGLFIAFLAATSSIALFSYFFASPLRASLIYLALGFIGGTYVNIAVFFSASYIPPMWPRKVDRNEIYQAIVAGGLDPVKCELETNSRRMHIIHLPSRSAFVIHRSTCLVFYFSEARYEIRSLVPDEPDWSRQASSWEDVVAYARKWAAAVESHALIPDLWAGFGQGFFAGDKHEATDNARSIPPEQTEISDRAQELASPEIKIISQELVRPDANFVSRERSPEEPRNLRLQVRSTNHFRRRSSLVGLITLVVFIGTAVGALLLSAYDHLAVTSTLVAVLVGGGAPAGLFLAWATYRLAADQAKPSAAEGVESTAVDVHHARPRPQTSLPDPRPNADPRNE